MFKNGTSCTLLRTRNENKQNTAATSIALDATDQILASCHGLVSNSQPFPHYYYSRLKHSQTKDFRTFFVCVWGNFGGKNITKWKRESPPPTPHQRHLRLGSRTAQPTEASGQDVAFPQAFLNRFIWRRNHDLRSLIP